MIDYVEGTVAHVGHGYAVVDVGGVGLRALVPASTAARLPAEGERARLFTHLHVREDAWTLYGFGTREELDAFTLLIGVSGLGPARALALLSGSSVSALRGEIARGNTTALMRIPGVGRKLAAQIVLDLKEKIGPVAAEGPDDGEVLAWLTGMGYSAAQAQQAVAGLPRDDAAPLEDRLRQALAILRPER